MRGESGQAMIEFALVLPLLVLLTFGTLELAFYLQQRSALNAAAYMAARSASVLGNSKSLTQQHTSHFASKTGMGWLEGSVGALKLEGSSNTRTSATLKAEASRLTGVFALVSGIDEKSMDTMTAAVTLPMEYDARKLGLSPTGSKVTHFLINYRNEKNTAPDFLKTGAAANLKAVETVLKQLQDAARKYEEVRKKLAREKPKPAAEWDAEGDAEWDAEAATKPKPKPKKPKPKKPKPKPKPGTKPAPGNGGAKPQPQPKPTPPPLPEIPGLDGILALQLIDGTAEPFRTDPAVIRNPRTAKGAGSNGYLGPAYEEGTGSAKGPKIADLNTKLEKYGEGLVSGKVDLYEVCRLVGKLKVPSQPPHPALKALDVAVEKAKKTMGKWTTRMAKDAKTTHKQFDRSEQALFRR